MTIELSTVFQLRKGWLANVSVGPLAAIGVDYLRALVSDVRLSRDVLLHIDKHGMNDFDIITSPFGLQKGLFIGDERYPNMLVVNYLYPDSATRYKVVLKCAQQGRELWVSTFHRLRPRQMKSLLKRGIIVKTHS